MTSPATAVTRASLVAVYGTLKRGLRNHHWLEGADFVGVDRLDTITLYDLGHCPAAKAERSRGVEVEVYRVTAPILGELDRLEDYRIRTPRAGMYDRILQRTAYGTAWLYLYNHDVRGCPAQHEGGWLPARQERRGHV